MSVYKCSIAKYQQDCLGDILAYNCHIIVFVCTEQVLYKQ